MKGLALYSMSISISVQHLFLWLISHQPAVLFSQNKLATSNQPTTLVPSEQISTSHQPPAKRTDCKFF
jgi:hypothetical protein